MDSTQVLIKPLLSEKSTRLSEQSRPQYVFLIRNDANKPQVAKAILELFQVKPVKVHIINTFGKWKRVRRQYGLTPTYKKAIVTLKHGEKIDFYESKK